MMRQVSWGILALYYSQWVGAKMLGLHLVHQQIANLQGLLCKRPAILTKADSLKSAGPMHCYL